MTRWIETDKGDPFGRELADRHYTRVSVGHPMWTRPGWNQVLLAEQRNGRRAVFVWWRPKWEAGLPGTARKDGLHCIECTIFRNETRFRSSELIREAVACLLSWEHALDVALPDGIITAVNSVKTRAGRSASSPPGVCFRLAGFTPFEHAGKSRRADLWLRYTDPLPAPLQPTRSERLAARRPSF
jgi:hypothetical protein